MNNKWIWVVAGIFVFILCFFIIVATIVRQAFNGSDDVTVGDGVGVVEVRGIISDSEETVKQLRDFGKNNRVKAVVLRIDSPGGVVGPSQEIWSAVKDLAKKKKVVVSMGSVAASGGYYIAAPATEIYANPGTITGSIGVLMKFSNIEGLMRKIGLKSFTIKAGQFKDIGSPDKPMTKQEKEMLQSVIDNTHMQFIKAVAEGRHIPETEVIKIADGRIFTGEQAMEVKLVDHLGTLQDAITEAGRLGGIKGEPKVIRTPKKRNSFLDLLLERSAGEFGSMMKKEKDFSINYEMQGMGE